MKIACIGGGPGGLYFAISMKFGDPDHEITVFERNRAGDTFGWDVVFSDQTFENIQVKNSRFGTPQRGLIFPLLANLYLHILDRIWERNDLATKFGAKIIRFAEDIVVLCKYDIDRPLALIKILDRLDLSLNTDKTHVVNARNQKFVFLGFELGMRKGENTFTQAS